MSNEAAAVIEPSDPRPMRDKMPGDATPIGRVNKTMAGCRGRLLHLLEDYLAGVLTPDELERLKRRAKMITGDAWDDIRKVVNEQEAVPSPIEQLTRIEAQVATVYTQVMEGGAGTIRQRVEQLERR